MSSSSGQPTQTYRWLTLTREDFDVLLGNMRGRLVNGGLDARVECPAVRLLAYNTLWSVKICSSRSRRSIADLEGYFGPINNVPLPYEYSRDMGEGQTQGCKMTAQPHVEGVSVSADTWWEIEEVKQQHPGAVIYLQCDVSEVPIPFEAGGSIRMETQHGPIVALPCIKPPYGEWRFKGFFAEYPNSSLVMNGRSIDLTTASGEPLKVGLKITGVQPLQPA